MIYFHIGLCKSASTFLQREIFEKCHGLSHIGKNSNKNRLSRDDIRLLTRMKDDGVDKENTSFMHICQEIEKLSASSNDIVFSEEDLSTFKFNNPSINIARFKGRFKKSKVLLIVREPQGWLNSLYYWRLSRGKPDTFCGESEWVEKNFNKIESSPVKDILVKDIIDIVRGNFKEEDFLILPFELIKENKPLFYKEVCVFLGLDYDEVIELSGTKNRSKDRIDLEKKESLLKLSEVFKEGRQTKRDSALSNIEDVFGGSFKMDFLASPFYEDHFRSENLANFITSKPSNGEKPSFPIDSKILNNIHLYNEEVYKELSTKYPDVSKYYSL